MQCGLLPRRSSRVPPASDPASSQSISVSSSSSAAIFLSVPQHAAERPSTTTRSLLATSQAPGDLTWRLMPLNARALIWQYAPFLRGPFYSPGDHTSQREAMIGPQGIRVLALNAVQAAICRMGHDVLDYIVGLVADSEHHKVAVVRAMRLGFFPLHISEGFYCEGSLKLTQLRAWSSILIPYEGRASRCRGRLHQQLEFTQYLPSTSITFEAWNFISHRALNYLALPNDLLRNCAEIVFLFCKRAPRWAMGRVGNEARVTTDETLTLAQLPCAERAMELLSPLKFLVYPAHRLRSVTIDLGSPAAESGFYNSQHAARHMFLADAPALETFILRGSLDGSIFAISQWPNLRHLEVTAALSGNDMVQISTGCPRLHSAVVFIDENSPPSAGSSPSFPSLETIVVTSSTQFWLFTSNGAAPALQKLLLATEDELDTADIATTLIGSSITLVGPHNSIRADLVVAQLYNILAMHVKPLTLLLENLEAEELDEFAETWLQTLHYAPVDGIIVADSKVGHIAVASLATLARGIVCTGGYLEFRNCLPSAKISHSWNWQETATGPVARMLETVEIRLIIC